MYLSLYCLIPEPRGLLGGAIVTSGEAWWSALEAGRREGGEAMSGTGGPAAEGEAPAGSAPALCIPGPGDKVAHDFQILVQKVGGRPEVLLIGEALGGQDIHGAMSSFVEDLFAAQCQPVHPGEAFLEGACAPCDIAGRRCQLIFFLCRAECLKRKQAELRKVLQQVKEFVRRSPCALVGVILEPTKGEALTARAQLLQLLRGVFPKSPKGTRKAQEAGGEELEDIEVEAEIYIPGQPRGKLAIMKAACRASDALDKGSPRARRVLKGLLGLALLAGLSAAAWWLLCSGGCTPLDKVNEFLQAFQS
ncbi:uncharacterized protein C2orf72 homolog isoform X2 [Anolis carolinensis]|uniref:uncharacterized protein C2orf72 homolog isoform X2 n=1 Tax=Anolis carolinensis TaxID=28377 RepID=UPI002F2B3564